MTVIVLDGPECAGKTTLIDAIVDQRGSQAWVREWGPVEGWHEYVVPFKEDLHNPARLHLWSRSWASEVAYNDLLKRGRDIDEKKIFYEFEHAWVRSQGVFYVMVEAPVHVLERRRRVRIENEEKPDLAVAPSDELARFKRYADEHDWMLVSGVADVEETAREILEIVK